MYGQISIRMFTVGHSYAFSAKRLKYSDTQSLPWVLLLLQMQYLIMCMWILWDLFQCQKVTHTFSHASIGSPDGWRQYLYQIRMTAQTVRYLKASPPRQQQRTSYVSDSLQTCTHAFVRCDAIKNLFKHYMTAPIDRSPKHFTFLVSGRKEVVSLDRLREVFVNKPIPSSDCLLLQKLLLQSLRKVLAISR